MGVIFYNNKSSKDYGIEVELLPLYEIPEPDYEIVHVPGKSGDVIMDKGSYKNVDRQYSIASGSEDGVFPILSNNIARWLRSAHGYARLEDSYEPEYYRLASYNESNTVDNIYGHAGRLTITFNCKPQRYLKIGEKKIRYDSSKSIMNFTDFPSLPIIDVYGTGAGIVSIGPYTINISNIGDHIRINSEVQDAYDGVTNKNGVITLDEFPKLNPGESFIVFTGGVTHLEVTPNWWTL